MRNGTPEHSQIDGAQRRKRRTDKSLDRWSNGSQSAILVMFCALLIWAPLPLGSNRDWSLAFLMVAIGAILAIWGAVSVANPASMNPRQGKLWPAASLLCVGLAFACLQVTDLRQADDVLGTNWTMELAHPIWGLASGALKTELPAYISVNPYLSEQAIGKTLLYAGAFWISFQLAQKASCASTILWTAFLTGSMNAAIGMIEVSAGFDVGSWLSGEAPVSGSRFNGTLVNPNNFATLAAMSLVAGMGLLFRLVSEGIILNRGPEVARRSILNTMNGPAFPTSATIFGLAGIIALSESRAGTFAMLVGALVLALSLNRWSNTSGKADRTTEPWSIVAIAAAGVLVSAAPFMLRLSYVENFGIREAFASDTLSAALAAPWTGNGYGAFEDYFPLYSSQFYPGTVNAAHNDYLEMFSDLGFLGGGALILAVVYLAFLSLLGVIRRRKRKYICAIGFAASMLCGFHAYFDFSLQIPAVGVVLFSLLGVSVAQSWQDRSETHDSRSQA